MNIDAREEIEEWVERRGEATHENCYQAFVFYMRDKINYTYQQTMDAWYSFMAGWEARGDE